MNAKEKHQIFNKSSKKQIVLITNHGCHAPVIQVTTDTGGQNFYVNDVAKALLKLGYKVSILNRGGYRHPFTKEMRRGVHYYDSVWGSSGKYCRLIYLEDNYKKFIKKEKLKKYNLEQEKEFFMKKAESLGMDLKDIYFINSNYWDAGILGNLIQDEIRKKYDVKIPHIWTPHSLGVLKRENYRKFPNADTRKFNFPSRIRFEEEVLSQVDGVVSTSTKIKQVLNKYDHKVKRQFWFPPGISTAHMHPRKRSQSKQGLQILSKIMGVSEKKALEEVKNKVMFVEVGRTTYTKKKDVVMEAFTHIKEENKDKCFLVTTIDDEAKTYDDLMRVYKNLNDGEHVYVIEDFLSREKIAQIYSLADCYITASVMEGWGMAVQEAAVSECAIISSKYVPFVTEVLKKNALIVNDSDPKSYAKKIDEMIDKPKLRKKLADDCYKLISNHYSWIDLSQELIKNMKKYKLIK